VKRWQHDLGRPQAGSIGVADVVFAAGPVRVAQTMADVGDEASTDALSVSGLVRTVTARAAAGNLTWATPGVRVQVALSNGKTVSGTVEHVGTTPAAGSDQDGGSAAGNGSASAVPITISVADQHALAEVTGEAAVTVTYVARVRRNVLVVPVEALVALSGGGYGLELVQGATSHYVAVTPGMFTDALVEVSGDQVTEGTVVRMPS
jgi:hypothetical protein